MAVLAVSLTWWGGAALEPKEAGAVNRAPLHSFCWRFYHGGPADVLISDRRFHLALPKFNKYPPPTRRVFYNFAAALRVKGTYLCIRCTHESHNMQNLDLTVRKVITMLTLGIGLIFAGNIFFCKMYHCYTNENIFIVWKCKLFIWSKIIWKGRKSYIKYR